MLAYTGSGGFANAALVQSQAIYLKISFRGGDTTTFHYSEPSAADEGMNAAEQLLPSQWA
jgi:hypothetical protein